MSETKWTPGPWSVGPVQRSVRIIVHESGTVARVHGSSQSTMDEDAQLIAAAPDLYEAAKDAEALLRSIEGQNALADELLARVRAALAKARGETP